MSKPIRVFSTTKTHVHPGLPYSSAESDYIIVEYAAMVLVAKLPD